jgi:hypothetical protein
MPADGPGVPGPTRIEIVVVLDRALADPDPFDAGTLEDAWAEPFVDDTEDNAVNWQSGILLPDFANGEFSGPEIAHAMPDGRVLFRGQDIVGELWPYSG